MKVAIVHYHLKPGGVTRVIENAYSALRERGVQMVALTSEAYQGDAGLPAAIVPALAYTLANEKPDPGALWFSLKKAARDALGGEPDLWHIHNHCLGKNTGVPQAVCRLAAEKPVLLQIHDFAEDGRPSNYAAMARHVPELDALYPQASQVHYGLLNSRDMNYLSQSGFAPASLHLLPNPVAMPDLPEPGVVAPGYEGRRLVLYPTRAIRRKNVGELLLWATLSKGQDDAFATTLAPNNPEAQPIHDRWKLFAQHHDLPVRFAMGESVDLAFPELMSAADAIISTSVAEGFGLAFLEPFLFGKGLVGRNLPDITRDFTNGDVTLDGLYNQLHAPLSWIDAEAFRGELAQALADYYAAYDREAPPGAADEAFDAMTDGDRVEFGTLSESLQEKIIQRLDRDPAAGESIAPNALAFERAKANVMANREVIARNFSLERYSENLLKLYHDVAKSPVEPLDYASSALVLDQFLDPRRFNLLRT